MSEEVFRWVVAAAVVLACLASVFQAIVVASLYRASKEARRAGKDVQAKLAPLLANVESILGSTRKLLEENGTLITELSSEALAVTKATRQHVEHVGELIDDISARTKTRVAQIDRTVEQTVEQVEHLGDAVRTAVVTPAKEVTGLVNGVKAAVTTYAQSKQRHSVEHATQDEEMFI